ncbi:unnamed protein product, partial [Mesorhabditis spiculigera]
MAHFGIVGCHFERWGEGNDRLEVLSAFLHSEVPLEGVAKKTEGFTVAELERLARRVQIATAIRGAKLCNEADLENGLENSRPLSTNQLETQVEIRLDEVGGMKEQKKTLEELLLWPGMYPNLFARCGVRMGRGVLLCGPSGCGKTILAKAFAAHTKFQTIFIKGPELLSKYIGSSEENVRNAFARARASAPCVLLFDELDSLAPRRGADSTGVTDRVVNQLLTEMDGAEGLNGVFVLGCTSRVDLIDPALLRPGRFDHKLVCDAPSEEDREEILEIVLKKIARQGEFNLKKLAEMSDSWTGADLNAWMLNAHFLASRKTPGEDTPITMDDILATAQTLMTTRLKGAHKGHSLLKKKSDALNLRFREVLRQIVEAKMAVYGDVMDDARFSLAEAKNRAGDFSQTVIQNVATARYRVQYTTENVVGVVLPTFTDRVKLWIEATVTQVGFPGILLFASIPNPLFDLAGITCGHFLVPFWSFFTATLIGKSIIKMHVQMLFVIVAFSEHYADRLLQVVAQIPRIGHKLREPFKEFLTQQRQALHGNKDHQSPKAGWVQNGLQLIVTGAILLFSLSIINCLAQRYYHRAHKPV